jgi:hypothetical protein
MELLTRSSRRGIVALLVAACGACSPSRPAARPPATVEIDGVPGRANAHLALASDGQLVGLAWAASDETGTDVYVTMSTDAGASFGPPVRVNTKAGTAKVNPETPPRLAVRGSGASAEVAVSWMAAVDGTTVRLAQSHDGGRTFGESLPISQPGAPGNRGWHAMTPLDADGRVALVWLDHRDMAATGHEAHAADPAAHGSADGAAMAQKSQLYFALSGPDGVRPETSVARGVCYCCKTSVVRGPDGSLYAAWRHVYPGNIRDIAFTVSRDGGRTFGSPVRVSDDQWELNGCPEDGPTMAVDAANRVHIVWPTVVTTADGEPAKALFYASSSDGTSFTPRERIPAAGSPNHPQLAIAGDGALGVVWEEFVDGAWRLAGATRTGGADARFTPMRLSSDASGRYPVIAPAADGWLVAWTGEGSPIRVQRVGPGPVS